jgi:hypothetical protein
MTMGLVSRFTAHRDLNEVQASGGKVAFGYFLLGP